MTPRPKGIVEKKARETKKRIRLVKALPKSETLWEAGQKAGYSKNSRKIYSAGTKRYIIQKLKSLGISKEDLQKQFDIIREMAIENGDLSNANRSTEAITL